MSRFLAGYFPDPAPWERVNAPSRRPLPESTAGAA
ncbi:hypothetical protein [Nocardia cerradoensis]|nr:hypothetical protein [Nocardia cerradoensis]